MPGLIESVVSAGIGAIDIALEETTAGKKVLGPLEPVDIFRFAVAGGSLVASYMRFERYYSDIAFYSSLPLVEKSIYKLIKGVTAAPTGARIIRIGPSPVTAPAKKEELF